MALYSPSIITIPWAANGQKATIPNATEAAGRASWPVGFPEVNALPLAAGGIPPNYLDFQGVLYALSVHAMYGQTGAPYAWQDSLDYPVGSKVMGSNGVEYTAVAASGPDSGGAKDPAGADASPFWILSQEVLPGIVVAFAGDVDLPGYLPCNGATVSRTTYAKLFEAIGTTYGAGDGSTTFALPNLTDRFIQGSGTAGMTKAAGVPNITGSILMKAPRDANNGFVSMLGQGQGALTNSDAVDNTWNGYLNYTVMGSTTGQRLLVDASKSNSAYGASTTVQPPALTMRYYIKY